MSGFLRSDNVELAKLDHTPAPGRLLPVPSDDAERSAFVKQLARAALDLGVQDSHAVVVIDKRIDAPASVRSHTRIGAPASIAEPATPTRASKAQRYYRIDVWVCGETATFCAQSALLPRELREHFVSDGITLEEADGSLEWFDPASISRLRIDVLMQTPGETQLRNIALKKRGAK